MANSTEFGRTDHPPVLYERTRVLWFPNAPDESIEDPIDRRNTPLYPALQLAIDEERKELELQVRYHIDKVREQCLSQLDDPDVKHALRVADRALPHLPHVYVEMVLNAARHGNRVNATKRIWSQTKLTGQVTEDQLDAIQIEITVGDQGEGFEDEDIPWEVDQLLERISSGLEGGNGYKGYIAGMAHETERGYMVLGGIRYYVVQHRRRLFQELPQLVGLE